MQRGSARKQKTKTQTAIGQLTLVEHALCPLDARASLIENLVHESGYYYCGGSGKRERARVRIFCPLGLAAGDELYLWGLLALTMTHAAAEAELRATPHWCLRQLGLIDAGSRRGGRQYARFAEALRRLSAVKYLSDAFYDPLRREHRRVSLGLLSYSLPCDPASSRAWRIAWDPMFWDMVRAASGHLRFELEAYRKLDPAARRLLLFACKIFWREVISPCIELEHMAVDLLGFSPTLAKRDMKVKVGRCIDALVVIGVIGDWEITKHQPGRYSVQLQRGPYFAKTPTARGEVTKVENHPLWDLLEQVGFEPTAAARLMRRYPAHLLEQWADITLAARERFGAAFFRKSPMAFFVDGVSKAHQGQRTAPDWWLQLRRVEDGESGELSREGGQVLDRLRTELFGAGDTDDDQRQRSPRSGLDSVGQLLRSG